MSYPIRGFCEIDMQGIRFNDELVWLNKHCSLADEYLSTAYTELGIDYPRYHRVDRLSKLALLGLDIFQQKGMLLNKLPGRTGLIFSNSIASHTTDEKYVTSSFIKDQIGFEKSPGLFIYTLPNIAIGEVCIRHQLNGEHVFMVSEYFDAHALAMYGYMLLTGSYVDECIICWIDESKNKIEALCFFLDKTIIFDNTSSFEVPCKNIHLNNLLTSIRSFKPYAYGAVSH